jgi:hypothetical protein
MQNKRREIHYWKNFKKNNIFPLNEYKATILDNYSSYMKENAPNTRHVIV